VTDPSGMEANLGSVLASQVGSVAFIKLSNPGKRNALSALMWGQLRSEFEALCANVDVRCVVIRGAGNEAFSAGADVSEFESVRCTPEQVEHYHEHLVAGAMDAIAACDIPVIAAIQGVCMGGGLEIASVCDIRIGSTSARFGAAVGLLGFPLAPRELQYLLRFAGSSTAAELLLEGRIFDAEEAKCRQLISRVVPDADFDSALKSVLGKICRGSPLAARVNKQQMRLLSKSDGQTSLQERRAFYQFADSEDYLIGRQAFLNKQAPTFKGV
jgi:enoyl-CoA hydratase